MKRSLIPTVALVSLCLLNCGGPEVLDDVGGDEQRGVSQLAVCVAICPGGQTVSCSGTVCSATDNQGVTCNGVFTPCPQQTATCGTWSGWYWDGNSITCGPRLSCGTYCDEYGYCDVNPATYKQEYSYRACFDHSGNYTHTEYRYQRGDSLYCGC